MIEPWIENPDEESMIIGRTQAVEFIGQLEEQWHNIATAYRKFGQTQVAYAFEECATMLEDKIENFANTK